MWPLLAQVPARVAPSAESPFRFPTKANELASKLVSETLHIETLRDDGVTPATNNRGVICLLNIDGGNGLFTGDAGIDAPHRAVDFMGTRGFAAGGLMFAQIFHHGSRRHVGTANFNPPMEPKGKVTTQATGFVSAPSEDPEHKYPAKKVTNASTRWRYEVHAMERTLRWHFSQSPNRLDLKTCVPVPFHALVEEESEAS